MCAPLNNACLWTADGLRAQYKDYLGVYDKTLVKHKDGSYEAVTKAELMTGMKEKRIGVGYAGTGWTNYADRNPYFFIE